MAEQTVGSSTLVFSPAEQARLTGAVGVLTSIGPDGYPHSVPVQITVDGHEVTCSTTEKARKVANLRRNPKASVCVHGEPKWCVTIQGSVTLESDSPGRVLIRLAPVRVVRWAEES
jgi:PPOX class probable F420-dependent enzyme